MVIDEIYHNRSSVLSRLFLVLSIQLTYITIKASLMYADDVQFIYQSSDSQAHNELGLRMF
uniref:Uncharacterized protein n=1 Tax=Glossina palpalis gambiensis TaxID=67801 RepID=A0A1B0B137_9MUSC